MANPAENKISEALAAYDFAGEVVGTVRFGKGHINDTFCVYTQTEEGDCVRYILQRMSAAAFQHPDQLMRNIVGVTDYLRGVIEKNGGDGARETMTVLRTKTGDTFFPVYREDVLSAVSRNARAVLRLGQGVRPVPVDAEGLPRGHVV